MNPFTLERLESPAEIARHLQQKPRSKIIAGGTNLIDLMKVNIERPAHLLDINLLPEAKITPTNAGGLRIGALVTNADAAYHAGVREQFPLLSDAILAGASPQLRNMATCGGNLLQRTRCYYFYDSSTACNKRQPGAGCDAIGGYNRIHAVFGTSPSCIAVHPSDMCVALAALDAKIQVVGPQGNREIAIGDFHRLPGDHPERDSHLLADEVILAIEIPSNHFADHFHYLKVRDRTSYAFALVSVAAALQIENGTMKKVAIAMGGVAHKPWRDLTAEELLIGNAPTAEIFTKFAEAFFRPAVGQGYNDFKISLGKRSLVRALTEAASRKGLG